MKQICFIERDPRVVGRAWSYSEPYADWLRSVYNTSRVLEPNSHVREALQRLLKLADGYRSRYFCKKMAIQTQAAIRNNDPLIEPLGQLLRDPTLY